jgi:hypothetical protein
VTVEPEFGVATTDAPEFRNPRIRFPICLNPQAAGTFARIFLTKTKTGAGRKIESGDRGGGRFRTG